MIYFLNNDLELQKIVTSENINRAQHEDEMNNLKMMTLEMDLAYAKSFLNDDIDHFGYYVKDAFHVAKIRRVEESHDGETLTVIGHHIFFSDMIYGRLVEDVRPVNRDAAFILSNTIGANTRWHPVITDTTGVLSTNFYWTTPMEVIEFVIENFRLEFEPEILFDGQKVNGLNVHFKKRLGEDKPKRVVFGPSTPTLEFNIDYSEIVTKLAVHGKGEEVGDGYGRRINFSDRNINRDGIVSPLGSRYLEDPNVTANYGNFNNEPKHANVIFEDIENVNELIEAGIEEYERLSRPQYIFTATVADIGDVNMGDSVLIVRREYGIYFRARVHKISVDLLNPEGAEVVLGDYEHFKETKAERSARRQRESNERAVNSRITQLKNAFDARFDGEVNQMREDFEQALIDAHAEIEAAEHRMLEDFEAFTGRHENLIDDLLDDVGSIDDWRANVDDFLGSARDITLDERFQEFNLDFQERIRNINVNTRNMLQGTLFDEPSKIRFTNLMTDENINYVQLGYDENGRVGLIEFLEQVTVYEGERYTFTVEYRSNNEEANSLNYFVIWSDEDFYRVRNDEGVEGIENLNTNGLWQNAYFTFVAEKDFTGTLQFQARTNNAQGLIDIRRPYLTNTANKEWVPHPNDNTQSIEEVSRRITELEEGRLELITRSEYDFETEQITQTVKDIEETVDTSRQMIVDINDYDVIKNGSEVMQTVLGFEQKVWLNDVADIGANLIPQSANAWEDGGLYSSGNPDNVNTGNIRMVKSIPILEGETYTLSDDSGYYSRLNNIRVHVYKNGESVLYRNPARGSTITFIANGDELRISLHPPGLPDWANIPTSQMEHLEYPVQIKLEKGATATPMMNALSRVEQLADRVSIRVQEIGSVDGADIITQSDIIVEDDRILIGSQQISSWRMASIISVNPTAVDVITESMNISADMNVAGDIRALSIEAIHADLMSVNSQIMETDILKSEWLDVDNALVERFYTSSAFIENAEIKAANIRDLDVIDIHANTFSSSVPGSNREITMYNGRARFMYGSIEIQTSSGRRTIIDGYLNRSHTTIKREPNFQSSNVTVDGDWFRTGSNPYRTAMEEYYVHVARYLRVTAAVHRWGNPSWADARMQTRSGHVSNTVTSGNAENAVYDWLRIDLGEPLDRPVSGSVLYQFRTRTTGNNVRFHIGNRFLTDFPDSL